jgi:hypothetical protein
MSKGTWSIKNNLHHSLAALLENNHFGNAPACQTIKIITVPSKVCIKEH